MADPFIAEIRIFPLTFAPYGWAWCDGQVLPIVQQTALYSLLGTNYGGDGKTTFGLPNLKGRAPVHPGQGPGLTPRRLGETGGAATVMLDQNHMPSHNHPVGAQNAPLGGTTIPAGNVLNQSGTSKLYDTTSPAPVAMSNQVLCPTGGGLAHNNMMPYLTVPFCIAMMGIYPPRP